MLRQTFNAMLQEEDGVLSFEWTLLLTLLTIGIVSGLTAARDAIIDELGDLSEAALNFDQSYSLAELDIFDGMGNLIFDTNASQYVDDGYLYVDCDRAGTANDQPGQVDQP